MVKFNAVLMAVCSLGIALSGCQHRHADFRSLDEQFLEAAENGDEKALRDLLKKGANVDAKEESGLSSLESSADRGDAKIVALLLEMGAKGKNEALLQTVGGGPVVIIVESGAESGTPGAGRSPAKGMMGHEQTTKLLLDKGADIEARDPEGLTPLIKAAAYGRTGVAALLIERGAQIEARDAGGGTALIEAACDCAVATMPDTFDVIQLLLEKGANINARNNEGNTALMVASNGGVVKTNIVKLLTENGADVSIKNNRGETALMIAKGSEVPDVVKILRSAGAKSH
jgi:ankyrin repeat protein